MADSSSPPSPDGGPDEVRGWARQLATLGHIGTMFPVAIGLGFLGGWWLDGQLGTRPWLGLLGFGLGVVAAMRNLIRSVRHLEESEAEESGSRDESGSSSEPPSTYDDSP